MLFLRWYLWVAPNILLAPCICGLLRKRSYRELPLFTAYTAVQFIFFVVSFALDRVPTVSLSLYRWAILILTAASAILELAVVYELAENLIVSHSSLSRVLRPLMRWVIAVLLLVTAASLATFNRESTERVMKAFQALDLPTNAIKLGLLLTLVLFARALRISWRSLPAGIALGFAISASAELAAAPLFSELGSSYYARIDVLRLIGFHACVLIWLIYIFLPSKPPSFTGDRPDRTDLEAWDQELQKMVR